MTKTNRGPKEISSTLADVLQALEGDGIYSEAVEKHECSTVAERAAQHQITGTLRQAYVLVEKAIGVLQEEGL